MTHAPQHPTSASTAEPAGAQPSGASGTEGQPSGTAPSGAQPSGASGTDARPAPDANPYTPFAARLTGRTTLSEHFVRLTFAGAQFAHLGPTRLDQRIKLVFTDPAQRASALAAPDWLTWWRAQEPAERPPMRTYTVRYVRPEVGELDVDVVTHGTDSPASAFAVGADLGSEIIVVGPDARVPGHEVAGVAYHPGSAERIVLIGDETAVPAILNAVEQHAGTARLSAFIEVPDAADILAAEPAPGIEITWLPRAAVPEAPVGQLAERGAVAPAAPEGQPSERAATAPEAPVAARGERLLAAVRAWAHAEIGPAEGAEDHGGHATTVASGAGSQDGSESELLLWEEAEGSDDVYAWVAADAPTVRELRRLLKAHGLDRRQCSFMAYWKPGATGS